MSTLPIALKSLIFIGLPKEEPYESEKERLTSGIPSETVNQLTAILFELETTFGPFTGHPYITHPSL